MVSTAIRSTCGTLILTTALRASQRRTVFDIVAAGLPIPVESRPTCDMAKLLPHAGGQEQIIVYRVRMRHDTNDPSHTGTVITPSRERDGRHLLRRGAVRGGLLWSLAVCVRRLRLDLTPGPFPGTLGESVRRMWWRP